MISTKLNLNDKLPLTCSRAGTCCHGNLVFLNPWELAILAREKQLTPKEFRNRHCDIGGIILRFDGGTDKRGKSACSLYIENVGCSVHMARPLACRLFPLGRQLQNEKALYIYQGSTFPCLDGCPEVADLPHLSVQDYLKEQLTDSFEKAQDAYLDLMQNLADVAFTLLLDTGFTETISSKTLALWRVIGNEDPSKLAERIGNKWIDQLMLPAISNEITDPKEFANEHNEQLQRMAQENFGSLTSDQEFHEAAVLMMGLTLYLARALGANPSTLAEHWVEVAKSHGAK